MCCSVLPLLLHPVSMSYTVQRAFFAKHERQPQTVYHVIMVPTTSFYINSFNHHHIPAHSVTVFTFPHQIFLITVLITGIHKIVFC